MNLMDGMMNVFYNKVANSLTFKTWMKEEFGIIYECDWWIRDEITEDYLSPMELVSYVQMWLDGEQIFINISLREDCTGFESFIVENGVKRDVELAKQVYGCGRIDATVCAFIEILHNQK